MPRDKSGERRAKSTAQRTREYRCLCQIGNYVDPWWSGHSERDYDTTGYNQRASEDKGHRGCLLKEEPRDQLCNDEEQNDIQAEELSKVPRRRVYSRSIREENRRGAR
jgi:hypothetical protein